MWVHLVFMPSNERIVYMFRCVTCMHPQKILVWALANSLVCCVCLKTSSIIIYRALASSAKKPSLPSLSLSNTHAFLVLSELAAAHQDMKKKDEEDANAATIFCDLPPSLLQRRRRSSLSVPEEMPSLRWPLLLPRLLLSSSSERSHGARCANQRLDGLRREFWRRRSRVIHDTDFGMRESQAFFSIRSRFLRFPLLGDCCCFCCSFISFFLWIITVSRKLSIIGDRTGPMDSLYLCIKSWFSNMWSSIKSNVASYKSNFRYMHFFGGWCQYSWAMSLWNPKPCLFSFFLLYLVFLFV